MTPLQPRLTALKPVLWGIVALCGSLIFSGLATAKESFVPSFANPVSEAFNWRAVEELGDLQMTCLTVDPRGALWIGLTNGVAYYDGSDIKRFGVEDGIAGGHTVSVLGTRAGEIYLFQRSGVSYFRDGQWTSVFQGRVNNETMEIATEGADGTVWAATQQGLLQIRGGKYVLHKGFGETLGAVFEDNFGNVWTVVLNDGKTYRIPVENGALAEPDKWEIMLESNASQSSRYGFAQSPDGLIWRFSTDPEDVARYYDPRTDVWGEKDFRDFGGSNQVQAQYQTRDGIVWTVSDGVLHGLVEGEWAIRRKLSSRHGPARASLVESETGDLWLLDYRISLYRIDYGSRRWRSFEGHLLQAETSDGDRWFVSEEGDALRNFGEAYLEWEKHDQQDGLIDTVVGLFELSNGSLWAVGSHQGVAALAIRTGDRWIRRTYPEFGDAIRNEKPVEMPSGKIALCSANYQDWIPRDVGGVMFVESDGRIAEDGLFPSPELHSRISNICMVGEDLIAIEGFTAYKYHGNIWSQLQLPEGIRGFWIDDVSVDSEGNIWLASWGYGVVKWDLENQWTAFSEKDGLASRFASSVMEDPVSKDMLVLTSDGVDRFDGTRWYAVGGPSELANHRSSSYLSAGRNGSIWIIQANKPWLDRALPQFDYRKPEGEAFRSILYQPDGDAPETHLEILHEPNTRDRGLSVVWSARDRWSETASRELRYSFRLDGGPWSEFIADQKHSFHQLDDGDHILEVRARDQSFNVDPTPAIHSFFIPPPIWRQSWFIFSTMGVTLLIIALVGIIFRQRWRHLIEYDEQRISFFTNISHELRTPLALILAPLEKVVEKTRDADRQRDLKLALKSARRLNQLVDQLLDFRKIESNAMESELARVDMVSQIDEIVGSFLPLAETKRQNLGFRCLEDSRYARYDQEKLHKVVANLVSNAVKYTPFDGTIRVTLEFLAREGREGERALIRVEDNGRGISANRQKHIFEPFYRGDSKAAHEATGTGLGLSLSKQLVSLLGGDIKVESPINESGAEKSGTRFSVTIPFEEVVQPDPHLEIEKLDTIAGRSTLDQGSSMESSDKDSRELRVLLVDDNEDLVDFLSRELSERYEVMSAENGLKGLQVARQHIPDLVIADVMMPEMNGIEFCKELKQDEATSHIPVIMLTARSSNEFEKLGLESGADEYLPKPISMVTLDLRIRNLLDTRAKLQSRLTSQFLSDPGTLVIENSEQAFLKKVVDTLDSHLSDPDFGVDELAELMGQSRSSFYRKLKAISNETPQGFLRRYRMKRAGQLLQGTTMTVTEIMFEVGYSDIGYFGKLFKAHHKSSPTEYRHIDSKSLSN